MMLRLKRMSHPSSKTQKLKESGNLQSIRYFKLNAMQFYRRLDAGKTRT
jgi:hypothetical protein